MSASPLILAGSPRRGHSLDIAKLAAESMAASLNSGMGQSLGLGLGMALVSFDPISLASCRVNPCINCGICSRPGPPCPQEAGDDSRALFERFMRAPMVLICAPVYFYHLPAQFKALLDRCQYYYCRKQAGDAELNALPPRSAHVILHAGRPRGEKLFEGSLLSLKYALAVFNLELQEPLLLRGTDEPDAILSDPDVRERIRGYACDAGAILRP